MRSLLAIAIVTILTAPVIAGDFRHVEDATLRSVHFIDAQEGWVVGDEGVILHTIDGGRHWERQTSPTRASLRSVHFLTPFVGWAVGREELPYGMGATGVVLFTRDGGIEWKAQLPNTLPGLNQVRFADPRTGFLLGDGSDAFPSGVFKTTDAGKSWEPVPGPRTTSWLAADFYTDGRNGVFAGGWSRFGVMRDDKAMTTAQQTMALKLGEQITNLQKKLITTPKQQAPAVQKQIADLHGELAKLLPASRVTIAEHADWLAGRDITSLQILGKKSLAVGHGGLLLTSVSTGKAWNFAETKLPTEVLATLDFNAMCSTKDQVWIVGRPGSVLLHSGDGGATWNLRKTGHTLPLHGIFFFDEKVGFAVGEAGAILASRDGGKTWSVQHQAGKRAAAIAIHSLNKNAPVDTLACLAADGYLTTSLRVTAPDPTVAGWDRLQDSRRYGFAMRRAGALTGETLWQFPMPQYLEGSDRKTILAHWNQLHAKRAEEELLRQLVLSLRTWRPDVIVTEDPDSKTALSALVGDAVQEAVRRAADAKAFPEQISELGLEPWQVRKVFGIGAGKDNVLRQDNDEPRPALESSARDFASTAHGLLTDRYTPLPAERSHRLLLGGTGGNAIRHWLEGVDAKVGESKRDLKADPKADGKLAYFLAQRRSILAMSENLDDSVRTLKLVPKALDELPDEHAAPTAFAIAGRYAERGEWYLAQEMYLYLVDRFPVHPLTSEAYRWLIRLNTSSEARHRHQLKHFALGEPIGVARKNGIALPKDKIIRVGNEEPALSLLQRPETREWNKGSSEWMKRLGGYGGCWAADPRMQFCFQSARRQLGDGAGALDTMKNLRNFVPGGPWNEAAEGEVWNANRVMQPPRRVGKARYTEVRPYLDGKLDDPCWQNMKPMVLDNAVGDTAKQYTSEAMFAFDQEFMYIALRCTHPTGQQVVPVKPRPRDADVDAFDRVSLLIDIDRDRSTYYHLEVDQRGCLRDSCWGDRRWNPRWFVAVHSTETAWQIEAAIPLSELSNDRINQGTAWAFNVVRIIPGRGVQSWSVPADVAPRPEGMSVLTFQTGGARPMPMP
ncbi:MAG TPA: YCF48-related protein [Gemmataceae bacterium]|nr:YCF48-related protein [Gemmataceae bacterium]